MNREAFEKVFPVPATMIRWDEVSQAYVSIRGGLSMTADTYNDRLRVWQAAKADSAAQVEALTFGLENLRLFAARHRKEGWAQSILLICNTVGVTGSPLRESEEPKP